MNGRSSANIWKTKRLLRNRRALNNRTKTPPLFILMEMANKKSARFFMRGVFRCKDSKVFEELYYETADAYRYTRTYLD